MSISLKILDHPILNYILLLNYGTGTNTKMVGVLFR